MNDDALDADGRSLGGKARAKKLSKVERSEIARLGGLAKKAKMLDAKLPIATHKGVLKIGELHSGLALFH